MYQDKDVYEGSFVEGKKHGFGKYTWADGRVYEGEFINDKMNQRKQKGFLGGLFGKK